MKQNDTTNKEKYHSRCEKCPYSELLWFAFSRIRTEYGEIRSISPYSVEIRENADQNNSEYGNFLRSVFKKSEILSNMISNNIYNKSQHFDIDVNVQVDNENTKTKQIWRTPNIRKSQNIQTNSKEISSPSKLFHDTLFAYFRGTCVSKRFYKILIPKSIKVI